MMIRLSLLLLIVALTVLAFGASLVSAQPDNPECWGVVSAQLAKSEVGAVGDHASQQAEPRAGLGNLSRELGFDHIGEFGSFLAEIDGVDGTECG